MVTFGLNHLGHENGDVKLIQSSDIVSGNISNRSPGQKISKEQIANGDYLQEGDVLFPAKGIKNEPYVVKVTDLPAVASSTFFVIKIKTAKVLPGYLAWYLRLRDVQHCLGILAEGSTIPSISIREFRAMKLRVPPIRIQKRILELDQLQESYQEKLKAIGQKTALINMELSKKLMQIENEQ